MTPFLPVILCKSPTIKLPGDTSLTRRTLKLLLSQGEQPHASVTIVTFSVYSVIIVAYFVYIINILPRKIPPLLSGPRMWRRGGGAANILHVWVIESERNPSTPLSAVKGYFGQLLFPDIFSYYLITINRLFAKS